MAFPEGNASTRFSQSSLTVLRLVLAGVAALCTLPPLAHCSEATRNEPSNVLEITGRGAIAEVLELIASKTKSNAQRILTWEGSYAFAGEELLRRPMPIKDGKSAWEGGEYWARTEGVSTFVISAESQSAFMVFNPKVTTYVARSGERIHFDAEPVEEREVITPEHHLSLRPSLRMGPLSDYPTTTIYRSPVGYANESPERYKVVVFGGRVVDPFLFFGDDGQQTWELASRFAKAYRDGTFTSEELARMKLTKQDSTAGSIYEFEVEFNPSGPNAAYRKTVTYTFSERAGLNLTRWEKRRDGKLQELRQIEFGETGGILFPRAVTVSRYDLKTSERRFFKEYTILDNKMNADLPVSQFSWEAMSPADGTRIVDGISKVMYVYHHGQLIDPEDYTPQVPGFNPARDEAGSLAWLSAVGAVLISAYIAWRRFSGRY